MVSSSAYGRNNLFSVIVTTYDIGQLGEKAILLLHQTRAGKTVASSGPGNRSDAGIGHVEEDGDFSAGQRRYFAAYRTESLQTPQGVVQTRQSVLQIGLRHRGHDGGDTVSRTLRDHV